MSDIYLSIIVPAKNEAESIKELIPEIDQKLSSYTDRLEVLIINDGSTDHTIETVKELQSQYSYVRLLTFHKNMKKTKALQLGFQQSCGEVIVTIDADLQDNPSDIVPMIDLLEQGYDLVSGWRQSRNDTKLKAMVSKVANRCVRIFSDISLHDTNAGLKVFRRSAVDVLPTNNDYHRFSPIILHELGFRVTELPIDNRERQYGVSHYGSVRLNRLFKSGYDFIVLLFLMKFASRPFYFFGTLSLVITGVGFLLGLYLVIIKYFNHTSIGDRPLLLFSMLCIIVGIQLFSIGLVSELVQTSRSRTYTRNKLPFSEE